MGKVCVIGIDGATFDLIRPLAAAGKLPALSRIMQEGAHGPLLTVPGLNSAAAWSSFITGTNPGRHGIFDFYRPVPGSYGIRFLNGGDREGESIWSLLSREGRRVGVVNVPMTYPAERVNGLLISGFDAPGTSSPGFAHPPSLMQDLRREVGRYTLLPGLVGYMLAGKEREGLEQVERCLAQRLAATEHLMRTREWDFFMVVFNAVDSVQHCFWKYMDPGFPGPTDEERRRFGGAIARFYSLLDDVVARLRNAVPDGTTVMVMSDHGAGPRHSAARQLNPWLESIGLLRFAPPPAAWRRLIGALVRGAYARLEQTPARGLKEFLVRMAPGLRDRVRSNLMVSGIDWPHTKAYADPVGSTIRLNLAEREPSGTVQPGQESEEVLGSIAQHLLECVDAATGAPAVEAVRRRETAFSGPHVPEAPELIIEWSQSTPVHALRSVASTAGDFPTGQFRAISGDHRPEGILLMAGPGVVPGKAIEGASIMDLFPTIVSLMGVAVPQGLDGRALAQAFSGELPSPTTAGSGNGGDGEPASEKHRYTAEEERLIRDRLRGLGYLE